MRIIEIKSLDNGSHRNQTSDLCVIPDGWAVINDDMKTPNFPFGEIEVEEIDGVITVTKWIPGVIPSIPTMDEPITIDDRVTALENALLELIIGGAE